MFRGTDTNNLWLVDCTSLAMMVMKRIAGSYTPVTTIASSAVASGGVIKATGAGSTITIYKDNMQMWQGTDSFNSGGTIHGFRIAGSSGFGNIRVDNCSVS